MKTVAGHLLGGVTGDVLERAFDYWRHVDEKTGAEIERLVRVGPDLGSPGAQDDKAQRRMCLEPDRRHRHARRIVSDGGGRTAGRTTVTREIGQTPSFLEAFFAALSTTLRDRARPLPQRRVIPQVLGRLADLAAARAPGACPEDVRPDADDAHGEPELESDMMSTLR